MGNKSSGEATSIYKQIEKKSFEHDKFQSKLVKLWKQFDNDNSGTLEKEEALRFFEVTYDFVYGGNDEEEVCPEVRTKTANLWYNHFDADGDGQISWLEFTAAATELSIKRKESSELEGACPLSQTRIDTLCELAIAGDTLGLRRNLLDYEVNDLNKGRNKHRQSLLLATAKSLQVDVLVDLLQFPDLEVVSSQDSLGNSPLHAVAEASHVELDSQSGANNSEEVSSSVVAAALLLAHGCDPLKQNDMGVNSIQLAMGGEGDVSFQREKLLEQCQECDNDVAKLLGEFVLKGPVCLAPFLPRINHHLQQTPKIDELGNHKLSGVVTSVDEDNGTTLADGTQYMANLYSNYLKLVLVDDSVDSNDAGPSHLVSGKKSVQMLSLANTSEPTSTVIYIPLAFTYIKNIKTISGSELQHSETASASGGLVSTESISASASSLAQPTIDIAGVETNISNKSTDISGNANSSTKSVLHVYKEIRSTKALNCLQCGEELKMRKVNYSGYGCARCNVVLHGKCRKNYTTKCQLRSSISLDGNNNGNGGTLERDHAWSHVNVQEPSNCSLCSLEIPVNTPMEDVYFCLFCTSYAHSECLKIQKNSGKGGIVSSRCITVKPDPLLYKYGIGEDNLSSLAESEDVTLSEYDDTAATGAIAGSSIGNRARTKSAYPAIGKSKKRHGVDATGHGLLAASTPNKVAKRGSKGLKKHRSRRNSKIVFDNDLIEQSGEGTLSRRSTSNRESNVKENGDGDDSPSSAVGLNGGIGLSESFEGGLGGGQTFSNRNKAVSVNYLGLSQGTSPKTPAKLLSHKTVSALKKEGKEKAKEKKVRRKHTRKFSNNVVVAGIVHAASSSASSSSVLQHLQAIKKRSETLTAFTLVSPVGTFRFIAVASQGWAQAIGDAVRLFVAQMQGINWFTPEVLAAGGLRAVGEKEMQGTRTGKYTYNRWGTYDGEWGPLGLPHGKGCLIDDNYNYTGTWNGQSNSGSGLVTRRANNNINSTNESKYQGKWHHELPLRGSQPVSRLLSQLAPHSTHKLQLPNPSSAKNTETTTLLIVLTITLLILLGHQMILLMGWRGYLISFAMGGLSMLIMGPVLMFLLYYYFLAPNVSRAVGQGELLVQPSKEIAEKVYTKEISIKEQLEQDEDAYSLTSGNIQLQLEGSKNARIDGYCVLKGKTLFFQPNKGNIKKIVLNGCYIRYAETSADSSLKHAVELLHPTRCLLHRKDFLFLLCGDTKNQQRWYFALQTICRPFRTLYSDKSLIQGHVGVEAFRSTMLEFYRKQWFEKKEQGYFLNALLSRFWIHIADSALIKSKLLDEITTLVAEKLEEANLQNMLHSIVVTELSFGSHPPRVSDLVAKPPSNIEAASHDMEVEISIDYKNGDIQAGVQAKVVTPVGTVPLAVTVHLRSIEEARLNIQCLPFPFSRFGIGLTKAPKLDIDIRVNAGGSKGHLSSFHKIKNLLMSKIRDVITEAVVVPNRVYVNFPGVMEDKPEAPVTEMNIGVNINGNNNMNAGNDVNMNITGEAGNSDKGSVDIDPTAEVTAVLEKEWGAMQDDGMGFNFDSSTPATKKNKSKKDEVAGLSPAKSRKLAKKEKEKEKKQVKKEEKKMAKAESLSLSSTPKRKKSKLSTIMKEKAKATSTLSFPKKRKDEDR